MPTPLIDTPASVEVPFPASAGACSMGFKTPTKSRPGARLQLASGLADQKDTDRLMDIVHGRPDRTPPRPSICPICGLSADNGVVTHAEVTATATYVDTAAHMWSVTWLEVA